MKDSEQILISAVRYALGRKTYIVGITTGYVKMKLEEGLSEQCKAVMIRDIEDAKDYGWDCDKENWMSLLLNLKNNY